MVLVSYWLLVMVECVLFTFCSRCLVLLTFDFLQFLFFLSVTNQGDYSNEDEADDEDDEDDMLLVAQSKKRSRP